MSLVSSVGAASDLAFRQAEGAAQQGASNLAGASSGKGDVAAGTVDLTAAKTETQIGVRLENTAAQMQQALLDMFV